jgi:uncharacterized protein YecT (DUF1311 family)
MSPAPTKVAFIIVSALTAVTAGAETGHELGDALYKRAGRHYSKAYVECYDKTVRGIDRWGCAIDEALLQNRRMNTTYRQVIVKLGKSPAIRLRRLQRAWIAERDSECHAPNLEFGYLDPGNDNGPNPWCVLDKTILRTLWLERYPK